MVSAAEGNVHTGTLTRGRVMTWCGSAYPVTETIEITARPQRAVCPSCLTRQEAQP